VGHFAGAPPLLARSDVGDAGDAQLLVSDFGRGPFGLGGLSDVLKADRRDRFFHF
jgi:hypothetical protein